MRRALTKQSDRIEPARAGYVEAGRLAWIIQLQFGRHPADISFDLPYAFARPARSPEQCNVVRVRLRVIRQDQTEKRRLACPIRTEQSPLLILSNGPIDLLQDRGPVVCDAHILHVHQGFSRRYVGCTLVVTLSKT